MVAVKELRAPQGLGAADREKVEKRAMQEAQSAAKIHHPHAVTLFDVIPASDVDAVIYLILEYVNGVTLAKGDTAGRQDRRAPSDCPLPASAIGARRGTRDGDYSP
jgi:serine/threonine protein kinase